MPPPDTYRRNQIAANIFPLLPSARTSAQAVTGAATSFFLSSFCSVTIDLCELRFPLEPSTGLRLRSGSPNIYKYSTVSSLASGPPSPTSITNPFHLFTFVQVYFKSPAQYPSVRIPHFHTHTSTTQPRLNLDTTMTLSSVPAALLKFQHRHDSQKPAPHSCPLVNDSVCPWLCPPLFPAPALTIMTRLLASGVVHAPPEEESNGCCPAVPAQSVEHQRYRLVVFFLKVRLAMPCGRGLSHELTKSTRVRHEMLGWNRRTQYRYQP